MFFKTFTSVIAASVFLIMNFGSASAAEEVHFPSEQVSLSPFRERPVKQKGEALLAQKEAPLVGYLSRPQGDGPFPAIVVMHGCGGLGSRLKKDVADRLVSLGYVVLVVDRSTTRQMKSTCQNTHSDDLFTRRTASMMHMGHSNFCRNVHSLT